MVPHILKASDPFAALSSVVGDFFNGGVGGGAVVVDAGDVPVPFDRLLVHEAHMTTTLGAFYGESVVLRVLDERRAGDTYLRKIILTVGDGHVVEVGVVRIHLEYTSADVRSEILSKQTPLGDILIQHDVMRRIEPKWFFRFDGPAALLGTFGRTIDGPVYGRVGVIHCDGQPAIELLEVVTGDRV